MYIYYVYILIINIIRFKIWHYTGSLVYQRPWNKQDELWEVLWQSFPSRTFSEKPISYKAVEGISNTSQSEGNIILLRLKISENIKYKVNIFIFF